MPPDTAPQDAFERLRALPFVELSSDGLVIHDTVREVVAAYLRATDPDRSRRYRIAAWRQHLAVLTHGNAERSRACFSSGSSNESSSCGSRTLDSGCFVQARKPSSLRPLPYPTERSSCALT